MREAVYINYDWWCLIPVFVDSRKTCAIVCAAQEEEHSNETVSVLSFGEAKYKIYVGNDCCD